MIPYYYLNNISPKGTEVWTDEFQKTDELDEAQAIGKGNRGLCATHSSIYETRIKKFFNHDRDCRGYFL